MKGNNIKILLVEDDKNAGFLLRENLRFAGYSVELAMDGVEAYHIFCNDSFDLCIVDIMLPVKDGLSLAKDIRDVDDSIPIIFLTARSLDDDKIEGFKVGGDDYITKPFNIEELLWRIKSVLKRRNFKIQSNEKQIYEFGEFVFNYVDRALSIADKTFNLSTKEADLIKVFIEHKNKVLSRSTIMKSVWGKDDYFVSKSMDVYLTKIRKYLADDDNVEIVNIHGHGYKLVEKT